MWRKIGEKFNRIRERVLGVARVVRQFVGEHFRIILTILAGLLIAAGVYHFRKPCDKKPVLVVTATKVPVVAARPIPKTQVIVTLMMVKPVPVIKLSTNSSAVTSKPVVARPPSMPRSETSTFLRNPLYENNPLFGLYDKIVMGVSTDEYFVEGVRRINVDLRGTADKVFIKYESGNAVPGLKFISPRKQVEMRFGVYFGDNIWQEMATPGAEIHLTLRSEPCNRIKAVVREAEYIYYDCAGTKHVYPKKVQK